MEIKNSWLDNLKEHCHNRFYLRGTSMLGIINTITAFLFNRVLVAVYSKKRNRIVSYFWDTATNWGPEE